VKAGRKRERGVALVAVLLSLTVLTAIAAGFLDTSTSVTLTARALDEQARLRAAADAGIHLALARLLDPDPLARPASDGTVWRERFEGMELLLSAQDLTGLVDLNRADGDLLRRLFEAAGVPSGEATTLADRVLDYRDRDELRHPSGAEDRDYAAAGAPFGAADRAFVNVEELRRVLGVTDPVYRAVQGSLTVAGSGSRPDLASAPPLVKTAIGVAAPEDPEATLPPAASTGTYRLRALARLPGGGIFLREAVVELRAGSSAPPVVLDWRHLWQLPPEFSISTAGADGSLAR